MSGASTLAESAALKSEMIERISSHMYAEFDKQFGAQVVRLELEVKRLTDQLAKAVRYIAVRDAALARVFDGERVPAGDAAKPTWANVFYELPTGQVAISYSPAEFGIIDCVPLTQESPWDGHSEEDAFRRLQDFAAMPVIAHVTFTEILEPIADLGNLFERLDAEMGTL